MEIKDTPFSVYSSLGPFLSLVSPTVNSAPISNSVNGWNFMEVPSNPRIIAGDSRNNQPKDSIDFGASLIPRKSRLSLTGLCLTIARTSVPSSILSDFQGDPSRTLPRPQTPSLTSLPPPLFPFSTSSPKQPSWHLKLSRKLLSLSLGPCHSLEPLAQQACICTQ